MKIELPVADANFVLEGDTWCSASLQVSSASTKLGAEDFHVLASRIIENSISPKEPSCGEINGHSVHWLASFAENHHTLYIHFDLPDRHIFVQSPSGVCIWHGVLTEQQFNQWQKHLVAHA